MNPGNQQIEQITVCFECEGEKLIGIVKRPHPSKPIGVLTIVAGGPQYRAGCGRQLYQLAEALGKQGYPVMRFDYRGIGDSEGEYHGIDFVEPDLGAAIKVFKQQVPELEKIVLWGGCNAASAAMMHAWKFPEISSMILGNPFIDSNEAKQAVQHAHYRKRLFEKTFWVKFLKGGFSLRYITDLLAGFLRKEEKHLSDKPARQQKSMDQKMLEGFKRFQGSALFLMSGLSLTSKQFDALVAKNKDWRVAVDRVENRRLDLPNADQAFSSEDSRARIIEAAIDWMNKSTINRNELTR